MSAFSEAIHCPILPKAIAGNSVFLCEREGYKIFREPSIAVDFIAPMPTAAELQRLYADASYFGGEIVGGYRDYGAQTEPLLPMFESVLERFEMEDQPRSILDIGCGCGYHLEAASRRGWDCFGMEVSDHARGIAATRLGAKAYLTTSLDDLPPRRYDVVVMLDVIEHLSNPEEVFFKLFSLGAIDATTTIIVTTPNARSREALIAPDKWLYRHPPYHVVYYSGSGLAYLLKRLKFRNVAVEGIFPVKGASVDGFSDEQSELNDGLCGFGGIMAIASGCDFPSFMHERYVPGTWSKITRYEHLPRYTLAGSLAKGKRVLDFGCGTGYGSRELAKTAASVVGCDLAVEAIEWARSEHGAPGLSFVINEDLGASLSEASFDLVVCFEVIEHLREEQQKELIKNFARVMAPGAQLLISTPNSEITAFYGENPFHLHELPMQEFEDLLRKEFSGVQLYDQCIGSGVLFKACGIKDASTEQRALGSGIAREVACWLAICTQEPLRPAADIVVWDWDQPYIARALEDERSALDLKYKAISFAHISRQSATALANTETVLASTKTALANTETVLANMKTVLASTKTALASTKTALANMKTVLANRITALKNTKMMLANTRAALAKQTEELGRNQQQTDSELLKTADHSEDPSARLSPKSDGDGAI